MNKCVIAASKRRDEAVSAGHMCPGDIDRKRFHRILTRTYERQRENFESLLGMEGVGTTTIRALSLIAEAVYGKRPGFRDPAWFSFAHGGKDGTLFPADRKTYDRTIDIMRGAVNAAKVGNRAEMEAVRRLARFCEPR